MPVKSGKHSSIGSYAGNVYPYPEIFQKLLQTIDHPTIEIRQVTLKIVMEIYQKHGFDKMRDGFIAKLPLKVLQ